MLVRAFVPKHRDHRLMVVFPARDIDAGSLAGLRVSTVRGDEQWSAELAAVLQRNNDVMIRTIYARDARLPQQPDVFPRLGSGLECGAKLQVFVHEAERLAVVGVEVQAAWL